MHPKVDPQRACNPLFGFTFPLPQPLYPRAPPVLVSFRRTHTPPKLVLGDALRLFVSPKTGPFARLQQTLRESREGEEAVDGGVLRSVGQLREDGKRERPRQGGGSRAPGAQNGVRKTKRTDSKAKSVSALFCCLGSFVSCLSFPVRAQNFLFLHTADMGCSSPSWQRYEGLRRHSSGCAQYWCLFCSHRSRV